MKRSASKAVSTCRCPSRRQRWSRYSSISGGNAPILQSSRAMFERYTGEAHRALLFSRLEATRLGATVIDTGHLLLALLNLKTGFAKRTLGHIPIDEIRQAIGTGADNPHTSGNPTAELPFADDVMRALQYAADEADRLGRGQIGVEHLLVGLLSVEMSSALLGRH